MVAHVRGVTPRDSCNQERGDADKDKQERCGAMLDPLDHTQESATRREQDRSSQIVPSALLQIARAKQTMLGLPRTGGRLRGVLHGWR
jgi:hypothetical protein